MRACFARLRLKELLNAGLSLVYPEICQLCNGGRAGAAEGFVCRACSEDIRFIRPPFCARCGAPFPGDISVAFECVNCRTRKLFFGSARSAVVATGNALEIIRRYKYNRATWFEPLLGSLLAQAGAPDLDATGPWNYIVPVPLHPTKLREREFNQAERLANYLEEACDIPVNRRLLQRVVPTRTQTQLSREERLRNLRNAFAIRPGARLQGERLVLVDDVFTTGATTNECARVLSQAGASEVCVWTVARGV